MSTACPQCGHHVLDHRSACPRCVGLGPQRSAPPRGAGGGPVSWQQTPWGRILIGLVLAQGLFYGLRHLLTGVLQATAEGPGDEPWADVRHLLILQGAQMFTLLLGG